MDAANVSLVENLPGKLDSEFSNYNLNEPQIMVGDSSGKSVDCSSPKVLISKIRLVNLLITLIYML